MKENYCVNCKHHKKLGFYGLNYCVRENMGRLNEVTGGRLFECKDLAAMLEQYIAKAIGLNQKNLLLIN